MDVAATRRALHAIAEYVLAGPQYATSGTIRLRVTQGGIATVAEPAIRVEGTDIVHADRRIALDGHSAAAIADALGVAPRPLADVYADTCGVPIDQPLTFDAAVASYLAQCFAAGDAALRRIAPTAPPTLWPEHFDVGISLDEVNYGVSPGDAHIDEPYAYVGPWQVPPGDFWNESFGASMRLGPTPDVDAIVTFFETGRMAAAAG